MAFRLIQISDCHLGPSRQFLYRDQPAFTHLKQVIEAAADWKPDALLLTGDLSEDASPASYALLAECVGKLNVGVLAIPGNHDDPAVMRCHFPHGPYAGPSLRDAGCWQVLLLDSTIPGKPSGRIGEGALDATRQLLQASDQPTLVTLHHQPMPIGSPWIDKYPLLEPDSFRKTVGAFPQVRCVTWGHVHQAWETDREGIRWVSGPSSVANGIPGSEKFQLDPGGPALRWFVLEENGAFETGVISVG